MQNKIDHANRILRLMENYPTITVKDLMYLIECRIEGEKFVISSYRCSVQMLQEQYDNRDNLERLQFIVWDALVKYNGKINTVIQNSNILRSITYFIRQETLMGRSYSTH